MGIHADRIYFSGLYASIVYDLELYILYVSAAGTGYKTVMSRWLITLQVPISKREWDLLGENAPLGPASSEGLYVCLYICMSVTL